jgi:hypothetical protein
MFSSTFQLSGGHEARLIFCRISSFARSSQEVRFYEPQVSCLLARGSPLFRPSLLDGLKVPTNIPHKKDCFVLRKKGRISNIIDSNREFKSALRLVKKLPISIERETHSLVIFHHIFNAFHIVCLLNTRSKCFHGHPQSYRLLPFLRVFLPLVLMGLFVARFATFFDDFGPMTVGRACRG